MMPLTNKQVLTMLLEAAQKCYDAGVCIEEAKAMARERWAHKRTLEAFFAALETVYMLGWLKQITKESKK